MKIISINLHYYDYGDYNDEYIVKHNYKKEELKEKLDLLEKITKNYEDFNEVEEFIENNFKIINCDKVTYEI